MDAQGNFELVTWVVLGSVILCNIVIIFMIWHFFRQARRDIRQMNTKIMRLEADQSKQRYIIAKILHLYSDTPLDGDNSAEDMLSHALRQAEKVVDSSVETDKNSLSPMDQHKLSIPALKDAEILDHVKEALANNQIAIYRQPIMTLPARKVRYYEVFSRILVGKEGYIPAHNFISIAMDHHLVQAIDKVFLLRCLQYLKNVSEAENGNEFFINISAHTFGSKEYIHQLLDYLTAHPKLSSCLIFEMAQSDTLGLSSTARHVMERMALLGCRFSMDQVKIFGVDINRLLELNISFVKLDAGALQKELSDITARKRIRRIKQGMDANGIHVII